MLEGIVVAGQRTPLYHTCSPPHRRPPRASAALASTPVAIHGATQRAPVAWSCTQKPLGAASAVAQEADSSFKYLQAPAAETAVVLVPATTVVNLARWVAAAAVASLPLVVQAGVCAATAWTAAVRVPTATAGAAVPAAAASLDMRWRPTAAVLRVCMAATAVAAAVITHTMVVGVVWKDHSRAATSQNNDGALTGNALPAAVSSITSSSGVGRNRVATKQLHVLCATWYYHSGAMPLVGQWWPTGTPDPSL